jgi:alkylhydroperoxidase family enzyme
MVTSMSESIQNSCVDCVDLGTRRRDFLAHAADLYGRPPAVDLDDDELAALDDTAAVLLAFPWLSDAELVEALWALANF